MAKLDGLGLSLKAGVEPRSGWNRGFELASTALLVLFPAQVAELERQKAAAEADKLALGQRLEREWEARDAAEAALRSAADAAARAAASDRAALQEALEKVQL